MNSIGGVIFIILILWMLARIWLWVLILTLGGLVSLFSCIASLLPFGIIDATIYFILSMVCFLFLQLFDDTQADDVSS